MGHLDGLVAVVTGAGRGIGRGEAILLASEGAAVVVNDLGTAVDGAGHDASPAEQVVGEITAAGGRAVASAADVATWDGAADLIHQAVDAFGGLDILVNNAGFLRDRMSFNMDEEDFDSVIRVHVKGHFAPLRWAASYWRDRAKAAGGRTYGRVINTTSEAGLWGTPGQANYAMAKSAICGLTLTAARELERYGVTVNAIAPRARTRMTETVLAGLTAQGDFDDLDPDNVAPAVAWLASPAAAGVNGRVFMVTGGRVHLIDGYREAAVVSKAARWTVDELVARQDELMAGQGSGIPAFGIGL